MAQQSTVSRFLNSPKDADELSGLVEDIRDAMSEYGVRLKHSTQTRLTPTLDVIATSHLPKELSTHCRSCCFLMSSTNVY